MSCLVLTTIARSVDGNDFRHAYLGRDLVPNGVYHAVGSRNLTKNSSSYILEGFNLESGVVSRVYAAKAKTYS